MKSYLNLNNQISFLSSAGMEFKDVSKQEAYEILTEYTYLHKLLIYKNFFSQYQVLENGEDDFNGLDFGDLYDLHRIDRRLREVLSDICIDVEYFFKVFILNTIECNQKFCNQFFYYDVIDIDKRFRIDDKMEKRAREFDDIYSQKMLKKWPNKKPVWVLNEYLSFGEVIEVFNLFVTTKKLHNYDLELYLLKHTKKLRNTTVHNNQIFYTMKTNKEDIDHLVNAFKSKYNIHITPKYFENYFVFTIGCTLLIYKMLAPNKYYEEQAEALFIRTHSVIKQNAIFKKHPNEHVLIDIRRVYKMIDKTY